MPLLGLTTRSRRTAPPPLNSSVRRQSIFFVFAPHRQVRVPHGWCCGPACVDLLRGSVVSRMLRAFSFLAFPCAALRAVLGIIEFVASRASCLRTPSPARHCRASKAALSCSHTSAWRAAVLTSHSSGRLRRRLTPALGTKGRPLWQHKTRSSRASC